LKHKCLSGTLKCHLNRERERERERERGRERERESSKKRRKRTRAIYFTHAHFILANLKSGEMSCIYCAIT